MEVGKITHYFPKIGVGVMQITKGEVSVGDMIHIKGHSTDFQQIIESMEIEHQKVEKAKEGDSVGLKVKERVREGDTVYKVSE